MDAFTAIAEPTRRHIMETLAAGGELAATDIHNLYPASAPAISQHLKILREANLVRVEKRGQQRIYFINPEPIRELQKWIEQFTANIEERYQALDRVLEIEKQRLSNKKKEKN